MQLFLILLWLLLAAACIWYGRLIDRCASGTMFFTVWYGLAAIFVVFAIAVPLRLWSMLPVVLRVIFLTAAGILAVAFLIVLCLIRTEFHASSEPGLDYIIVLGAQVRPTGPSPVLLFRLVCALEYLKKSPDTICIVSGGRGPDEPCSEAEGMAQYLVQQGIPAERLLLEPESADTVQNIAYSRRLMQNPEQASVGIVTNNFHVFRALQTAKKHGLPQAVGIAAYCTKRYLPNNLFREFLGEIKFLIRNL